MDGASGVKGKKIGRTLAYLAQRSMWRRQRCTQPQRFKSIMLTIPGAFVLLPTDACLWLGDVKYRYRSKLLLPGSYLALRQGMTVDNLDKRIPGTCSVNQVHALSK